MHERRVKRFEDPTRLAELNPGETLKRAGFAEGMTLCDIGAGTGVFAFPAAQISREDIFALDISDDMIGLLQERATERKVNNLVVKKVESEVLPLPDSTSDMAIMVTVLHEIANKTMMLKEIKRIIKEKGRLMIIEFHQRTTPMGPPLDHRIGEDYTEELCNSNGLRTVDKFTLGDNFYCLVFECA